MGFEIFINIVFFNNWIHHTSTSIIVGTLISLCFVWIYLCDRKLLLTFNFFMERKGAFRRISAFLCGWLNGLKYSVKIEEMKIFVQIQKDLVFLGINPNESNRINWKTIMGILLFGLNLLSVFIFIFSIENDNLMDYVNGFCIFCAMCELCTCLLAIIWQKSKLFQVIGSFERLINHSKLCLVEKVGILSMKM